MKFLKDTIDFSAYERMTEFKAIVRKASAFVDRLKQLASPKRHESTGHMFSTKLRNRLYFPAGGTTCYAGYNGHRKSTFTGQVALDLGVQHHRCLLMSLEMLPEETLLRMLRQASGKEHPSDDDLARFMAWTDDRIWLFDHRGRVSPSHALGVVRYFADELHGNDVFIDSLMMVCHSEEHLDEQKQFATDLVSTAQETDMHLHLVAHCRKPQTRDGEDKPPTKYELRGAAAISDQLDSVLTVWANKPKERKLDDGSSYGDLASYPDAIISVEKQRKFGFERAVKLWFDSNSMRFVDDATSPIEPYAFMGSGGHQGASHTGKTDPGPF